MWQCICTYLHRSEQGRIRVLVLTHGQVGCAMAEVANTLLGGADAVGLAMAMDEAVDHALNRAVSLVRELDEGCGCLLLVDMGSLTFFGEELTRRTGVPVRCLARVDTLMVMDAVRRAAPGQGYTLAELAQALEQERRYPAPQEPPVHSNKQPVLLSLCITGEGNARRLHEFLDRSMPHFSKQVVIRELGMLDRQTMLSQVEQLKQNCDILAVVGTMDPGLPGIPYLTMDHVYSGHGSMTLNTLLANHGSQQVHLRDVVQPELVWVEEERVSKTDIIDKLCGMLHENGCVDDAFLLSVYKRENMGDTCLGEGIAIPHGEAAHVTKPAIAVAKLQHPVEWSAGIVADFVFLFALDEKSGGYVEKFYQLISDKNWLDSVRKTADATELYELVL